MRIIFSILLCGFVVLTGCNRTSAITAMRIDPALMMLVPADTAILVGAKLDKLRETPTYQKHFSNVPMPRLDEFQKETGLDPRRDIWEVLFASNGSQSGVLMVRGKFATGELEPRLERQGATRTGYKGYNLFGDDRNAVFFMNSSTAVAGSTLALKAMIDGRNRSGAGVPAALKPLLSAIPGASQFWAVFNGSSINLPFSSDSNLGNMNQIIRFIQNGRFSADLRNGFDFQATGTCNKDEEAKQIYTLLKGVIGFGRLSTPDNQPEMLKVYDAINVKQDGRLINVAANVPQNVVDQFIGTFAGSRRR